ncbi:MAG TPA: hypothetical protein VF175_17400 [Lacipirellula sp.]
MVDEAAAARTPFRFGMRSLLIAITIVALAAGLIPFAPLLLVLWAAAFAVQCLVFVLVLRLVVWIAGTPSEKLERGPDEGSGS